MKIATYLKKEITQMPFKGMRGRESDWLDVTELPLLNGKVSVVDASCAAQSSCASTHKCSSGCYMVSVKLMEYGCDRRVSRIRLCLPKSQPDLGRKTGEIGVDCATIGIWDAPFASDYHRNKEACLKKIAIAGRKLCLPWKRRLCVNARLTAGGGSMVIAETGFGDGTYPIYELRHVGKRVGLEIVFIKPEQRYPFEVEKPAELDETTRSDEALHWSAIEKYWKKGCESLDRGGKAAHQFFGKLEPGQSALLAIDMFNKELLHGGMYTFALSRRAVLLKEILAGYKLLGANDYWERIQAVASILEPITGIDDFRAKLEVVDALFSGATLKSLIGFQEWFAESMQDEERRVEKFVRRYIESHPDEFHG